MKREIIIKFTEEFSKETVQNGMLSKEESAQFILDKLKYYFAADDPINIEIVSTEDKGEEKRPLTIKDFEKNDTVYTVKLNTGCWYKDRPIAPTIKTEKVASIGRKYLKTATDSQFENAGKKYLLENVSYGSKRLLFKTQSDVTDYLEKEILIKWLSNLTDIEKYSVEQLRKVKEILEKD